MLRLYTVPIQKPLVAPTLCGYGILYPIGLGKIERQNAMTQPTANVIVEPAVIARENGHGRNIGDDVDDNDPYLYGWRYDFVIHPDGTETLERIPLTGYDVVFPLEGDILPVRSDHETASVHGYDVLYLQAGEDPTALVLKEVRIDFEQPDLEAVTPDIAFVKGVTRFILWSTFYVLQEGATVELVVEITSPNTRHLDVEKSMLNKAELARLQRDQRKNPKTRSKFYVYEQVGIPIYVIIDNARRKLGAPPPIIVYILTPDGYERLWPNEDGLVWIAILRVFIGTSGTEVSWFDENCQEIGNFRDLAHALRVADQRIVDAQKEADEAKERAAFLEEEMDEAQERAALLEEENQSMRQELDQAQDTIAKAQSEALSAQQALLQSKLETAKRLIGILDEAAISAATGLSVEEIRTLSQDDNSDT